MYLITSQDVFFRLSHYFAINHHEELCVVKELPGAKLYHADISFENDSRVFDVDNLYFYGTAAEAKGIMDLLLKKMSGRFQMVSIFHETFECKVHTLHRIFGDVEELSAVLGLGSLLSLTQQQRRDMAMQPFKERLWTACKDKTEEVEKVGTGANDELPKGMAEIIKQFGNLSDNIRKLFGGSNEPGQQRLGLGGVMTDAQIAQVVLDHDMIAPFFMDTIREVDGQPVISFGLGSMGYDTRLRPIFKLFKKDPNTGTIDPKAFNERHVEIVEGDVIELPPKTYALSETVERFNMPNDVMAFCLAKSTYARCCIGVNTTPIWPGFKGHVVIEFYNHGDVPVKIYANEGFAQFVFMRASHDVNRNYADRGGVYHGQETGVQSAKVGKQ